MISVLKGVDNRNTKIKKAKKLHKYTIVNHFSTVWNIVVVVFLLPMSGLILFCKPFYMSGGWSYLQERYLP